MVHRNTMPQGTAQLNYSRSIPKRYLMHLLQRTLLFGLVCVPLYGTDVLLTADGNSGYDSNVWTTRYDSGVNCWGIRGTGSPLAGKMWWNSFPGPTARYHVYLGAVLENDGDSPYRLYIDGQEVASGRFPYADGHLSCSPTKHRVADIDMGQHTVAAGARVEYWAQSVYPCGSSNGQYSRFYRIKFVPIGGGPDDTTPPGEPGNLHQTGATNVSVTLAWNAAHDPESGIRHYRVYRGNTVVLDNIADTTATLGGLTRNTTYTDMRVSAVNGALLEGNTSSPITVSTADESAPAGTLFLRAGDGALANGMAQTSADGSLSGSPIYGTTGSLSSPDPSHSRVTYTITLPVTGTWYLWGRVQYRDDARNSWWITVDGGSALNLANGDHWNDWHWEGLRAGGPVNLGTVAAGTRTLVVSSRETGDDNLLDVLCLSPVASYVPTDADVDFAQVEIEKVRLLSPRGGETFRVGETLSITWRSDERFIADVDLWISLDDGETWGKINTGGSITLLDEQWGDFPWVIPHEIAVDGTLRSTVSRECLVRVAKYGGGADDEQDESPASFWIEQGSATRIAEGDRASRLPHRGGREYFTIRGEQISNGLSASNHAAGLLIDAASRRVVLSTRQ